MRMMRMMMMMMMMGIYLSIDADPGRVPELAELLRTVLNASL